MSSRASTARHPSGDQVILVQAARRPRRGREQYKPVGPWEGQRARAGALRAEVCELRPHCVARARTSSRTAASKPLPAYDDLDAEQPLRTSLPHVRWPDPKGVVTSCGEVSTGVIKPYECKVFGTSMQPERTIGKCMVSPKATAAAVLKYGGFAREREVCVSATRGSGSSRSSQRARSKPAKFRDAEPHHDAHGPPAARRRRGLSKACCARVRDGPARRPAATVKARDHHGRIRVDRLALPRRLDRGPGRSTGTVNDHPPSPAPPRSRWSPLAHRGGLDAETLTPRVNAIAAAAARPACRCRRRHQGSSSADNADGNVITKTGIGRSPRRNGARPCARLRRPGG